MSETINDIVIGQLNKKKQHLLELREKIDNTNYVEPQTPSKILTLLVEIERLEKLVIKEK